MIKDMTIQTFLDELASKASTPGGGGGAAVAISSGGVSSPRFSNQ